MPGLSILFLTGIAVLIPNLNYAARNMTVEDYFTKSRAGKSPAYFLVEKSISEPIRVAVFYGYENNEKLCNELVELYMERYPLSR